VAIKFRSKLHTMYVNNFGRRLPAFFMDLKATLRSQAGYPDVKIWLAQVGPWRQGSIVREFDHVDAVKPRRTRKLDSL
jgi:hypothetical protein